MADPSNPYANLTPQELAYLGLSPTGASLAAGGVSAPPDVGNQLGGFVKQHPLMLLGGIGALGLVLILAGGK